MRDEEAVLTYEADGENRGVARLVLVRRVSKGDEPLDAIEEGAHDSSHLTGLRAWVCDATEDAVL
jgi:hypothetical protein